ncbi:helix-turn-helix domain-containing protein [Streptomyces sp. RKAG337]|uniref:helix-turn-helix domain-containing protein n=1 Tax=Streptomyces sp. RKAG337 TaxID=2893404 RepID=UPI002034424F|nr:helix-turn-helix transcriptional regulator [Streptomyces sp. RKAG337]MCM2430151.1 helix-turn-helix domain-containing protein [Streptomyces sp. RKAG337]
MPASPSSSAQEARRSLAARLGEIRRDGGLSGKALAARCGWSPAKVSRIENAKTPPSDADIHAWCTACGAKERAPDLVAANRSVDSLYVEWRRIHRDGLRHSQNAMVPLYERTRTFRVYCSNVVPGLLQTPGYASALLSTITAFQGTPDDVSSAVAARMARSRVIHAPRHTFAFLVEESVLRNRIADPSVMAGQLGYLLAIMSLPSVALGIVPFTAQRGMWPLETFMIFDDDSVQVELLTAFVNVVAPGDIATYGHAFTSMQELAVYGSAARILITSAIDALG